MATLLCSIRSPSPLRCLEWRTRNHLWLPSSHDALVFALVVMSSTLGFSQESPSNGLDLHEATLRIYDRIESIQPCFNRETPVFRGRSVRSRASLRGPVAR